MVDVTENTDSYELHEELIPKVTRALLDVSKVELSAAFEGLHAADVADLLEQLDHDQRLEILSLAPEVIDGDILSELDDSIREGILEALPDRQITEALGDLESDDVVDIIEDLEPQAQNEILETLDDADRLAIRQSLSYPEDSAGRLMQREVVFCGEHWNVGQAIDYIRASDDLPEQFYHMILVNPKFQPVGYVALGRMLGARRETMLSDITEDSFRTIPATQDQGEVAYAFNQYHLISAPVINEDQRLVGVITIDDAMIALDEEHEEDIFRLAGVSEGSLTDRVFETSKNRFPWLGVNLITAILASLVIAQFEVALGQLVALAVLMPIVASMGGNAGTQSLTVAVRAMAKKDLTASNLWRVVRRECLVGLINGVAFAVIMGLIGMVWFNSPMLGVVLALAMVLNLIIAGFAGSIIPVVLERLGIDPALASGVFVTTVTDVVGFLTFLGLAAMLLL